jgi:hypothetical protein
MNEETIRERETSKPMFQSKETKVLDDSGMVSEIAHLNDLMLTDVGNSKSYDGYSIFL